MTMKTTQMQELPECDFCKQAKEQGKRELVEPAEYDCKTVRGPHAYMCQEHFDQYGTQLGTKLVRPVKQADETLNKADAICNRCGKGCSEDSWNRTEMRYRLLDKPDMVEVMIMTGLYCEELGI